MPVPAGLKRERTLYSFRLRPLPSCSLKSKKLTGCGGLTVFYGHCRRIGFPVQGAVILLGLGRSAEILFHFFRS
jgi:hypothetical protein